MLRFILYVILFVVLFRLAGAVIRMLVGNSAARGQAPRRPRNSNVDVNQEPQSKKPEGYKGGEYIDYEEVDEA